MIKMSRYMAIAQQLRNHIRNGRYATGVQLPLEVDLARQFKVNRLTLRHALALLEEEKLIRRERGNGTFVEQLPAPAHGAGRLLYLGDFEGHLFKDLFMAMAAEAQRTGGSVVPFDPKHAGQSPSSLEQLGDLVRNADAVVVATPDALDNPMCRDQVKSTRTVRFLFHDTPATEPAYYVQLDSREAARLAADHLLQLGHRRLAYVGVHPLAAPTAEAPFPAPSSQGAHYSGFLTALVQAGVTEHRALGIYMHMAEAAGERQLEAFLRHLDGWATGIVCDSDYRAMMLSHAATRLGLALPGALSITGSGQTPWSEAVRPKLTTVSLKEREAAVLAVQLCRLPPPSEPVIFSVQPRLVSKESTAAPRG